MLWGDTLGLQGICFHPVASGTSCHLIIQTGGTQSERKSRLQYGFAYGALNIQRTSQRVSELEPMVGTVRDLQGFYLRQGRRSQLT